ncbi:Peroxisomal catalase [Pseudomonas syringae pv. solidagae]|nr:Peroxisomal catalase [Pseudomonas syringae pv. solidagae]
MLQLTLHDITGNACHCAGNIANQQGLLISAHQVEQLACLTVVIAVYSMIMTICCTIQRQRRLRVARILFRRIRVAVRFIVWRRTAIGAEGHRPVTLIAVHRTLGRIDRQLLVVGTYAIAMRISIGKYAPLQHAVWRKANAWHHVAWAKRGLLDFGKVVERVTVQLQLAHLDQRVFFLRPGLGHVERVFMMIRRLSFGHQLDAHLPLGEVALLDGSEQIALSVIRISTGNARSLCGRQILDPLAGLVMPLHPMTLTCCTDEAIGVAAEAVHVTVAVRNATIGEQNSDLVQRFRRVRPEISHHLRALQIGLRQALLSVNEIREFQGVTDKEHRRVVTDDVPVTFLGVKLDRKATRVTLGISRTTLAAYGGEAQENRRLLANRVEQPGAGILADVAGHGERTMSTRPLGVHATLRDVFTVEVGKLFDQMEIIEQ